MAGGFIQAMRRLAPRVTVAATTSMAVVINGLMLAGYAAAAIVGTRVPAFSLSAAALAFWNGIFHLGGSVRGRRYAPGTVSGLALYVPLAVSAYWAFAQAGLLTATTFAVSFTAGLLYP